MSVKARKRVDGRAMLYRDDYAHSDAQSHREAPT
jgi:hypothetical protein